MTKIILSGCNGYMGKVISGICASDPEAGIAAGIDRLAKKLADYPVYADIMEFTGPADCLLDFSAPAAIDGLLTYCVRKKLPAVICTTGYSPEQLDKIAEAATKIPVFKSGNMSLGINVMLELVKRAAAVLGAAYDVEIVEKHHRRKVDAPSGTALMIADAASAALSYEADYIYERNSVRAPRDDRQIGISSVRGGTIVGEHEILFAGRDEVLSISHSAYSREVFAVGAVRACKYIAKIEKPGMYNMSDLLSEVLP